MVHFAEISQAPSSYSMLQHIGRVATPKLVPTNCLRYLQTTLIMGSGGLVSEFMWGIADLYICIYKHFVPSFKRFYGWVRKYIINGDKNLPNLYAFWDVTEKKPYIMFIGDISRFSLITLRNTKNRKKWKFLLQN